MKTTTLFVFIALGAMSTSLKGSTNECGVYKTIADFENEKISTIGTIIESPNYNVGELNVELKDKKIVKINCSHEKYIGFKYIDGNNYFFIVGVFAKVEILGNLN